MCGKFMEIFSKIFGKKEKEEGQERKQQIEQTGKTEQTKQTDGNLERTNREKILYKDLDAFIKKRQKDDEAKLKEKAEPMIDECIRSIENMKGIINEIKNEKITGLNKRAERIVESNKNMFIKITENALNTEINKDGSISEIKATILKIAQTCGETDIQYGRYVSIAHSQMENFRRNLKLLANNAMELNKMNVEHYEEYEILESKFNIYIDAKKRHTEIKMFIDALEKEQYNEQENLKELKNSEKFKYMNNALNEMAEILAEKDRIETSIYSKISSIGRILKKLRRQTNIKEISFYIDEPKIFLERNENELLNFIKLPADLNEDEKVKIAAFEKEFPVLVEEKNMYKELLKKEEATNDNIKKFDVRTQIKDIEEKINNIKIKIEENKKELAHIERNIENLKTEIYDTKKRLENKLNVEIVMDM